MAQEHVADVQKHVANPNTAAIDGIVKHLGIALQSRDASLVACSDKSERDRVRDSWLKKHLGLTQSDAELDAAVEEVCQKMHAEREKPRVTFYYLLAEKYGKVESLA